MSTPIFYIATPVLIAFVLFFFRKKSKLLIAASMTLYGLLTLLAYFQVFGEVLQLGPLSIDLSTSLSVLGREFILSNSDRFFLIITCLSSLIWLGGLRSSGLAVNVIPYQMLVTASLTAALAVDPFVYSAIFVEIAVLCSMPLLIHAKAPLSKGVIRFLIFQSISLPLILLGGWLVAGSQASPSDLQQIGFAGFLLGSGFAFWLAVFPFHTWIPQLSEDTHSYIAGFLLTIFPLVALLVIVDFSSSITWIRESNLFQTIFLFVGVIMLIAAAFWGLYEKKIKRYLGNLVLFETGSLLILIGLQTSFSVEAFYLSLLPRSLALLLASFCLAIMLGEEASTNDITGSIKDFPFASIGLLVALFSIIGIPLMGEFPFKLILFNSLESSTELKPIWLVIGFIGILIPLFGIFTRVFTPIKSRFQIHETWTQITLISVGILLLLLIGIFPGGLRLMVSHLLQYLPFIQ
jgi:NADH-quinone oxidoreductase subunit N